MRRVCFIVTLLMVSERSCFSSQSGAYTQGYISAKAHHDKSIGLLKKGDLSLVPGFKGDAPYEVSLDHGALGDQALRTSTLHPASTYMHKHAVAKKKITVSDMEDFMNNGDKAVTHPEKNLNDITLTKQAVKGTAHEDIVTCEEGGDEYTQSCSRFRHVSIGIIPEIKETRKQCPGHYRKKGNWWQSKTWYEQCGGCQSYEVIVQHRSVYVASEYWSDGCAVLENHADDGLCHYMSLEKGPHETRYIRGEPVSRSHWSEHYTYACRQEGKDNCEALKARGCKHIDSRCISHMGSVCTRWQQIYSCKRKTHQTTSYKAKGKNVPFCLTGDCADTRYEENAEMLDALSHLAILGEAQKDMRSHVGVFRGQVRGCRKNCTSFRDCCTTGKGWGVSLNLAECNGSEKELAIWREKKRCILVGTYCAEKILGTCLRKITNFCCFGTKLSRLIQENGRRQLGLDFGDPKCPDCRGLTPEELSRLDFSKMDLSELFEDIKNNFKAPDATHINQNIQERIQDNMSAMTHSIKPRSGNMQ